MRLHIRQYLRWVGVVLLTITGVIAFWQENYVYINPLYILIALVLILAVTLWQSYKNN